MITANTLGSAFEQAFQMLKEAGVGEARLDARLLVAHATENETATIFGFPERPIENQQVLLLEASLRRRIAREPMAYILKTREFWSLPFIVSSDTLVPRPDSETLIEAVLEHIPETRRNLSILDLGTGSGCLLLSLLSKFSNAIGIGVDASEAALDIAKQNAAALGLEERATFVVSDWTEKVEDQFDIVIANPPYIPSSDIPNLEADVAQYEPLSALDGGANGLDSYRKILRQLPKVLTDDASIFLESGAGQASAVSKMVREIGFQHIETKKDLAGIERCVIGKLRILPII
ncbi:MAG: peptide chain release factor N(5)-glutamine methyltransferase [Rhodospirillales bacterium]